MAEGAPAPRTSFRILTRRRDAYDGGVMHDVQLQVASTGALVWAQTFSDEAQAREFEAQLASDLDTLDDAAFRRKYSVPTSA